MKKTIHLLMLLMALLAWPDVLRADNWAYYVMGDLNSTDHSNSSIYANAYKLGDTSDGSGSYVSFSKTFKGSVLDPDQDGTAQLTIAVDFNYT